MKNYVIRIEKSSNWKEKTIDDCYSQEWEIFRTNVSWEREREEKMVKCFDKSKLLSNFQEIEFFEKGISENSSYICRRKGKIWPVPTPFTCKDPRFPRPRRDAILPRNHFIKFLRVPATFVKNLRCTFIYLYRESLFIVTIW